MSRNYSPDETLIDQLLLDDTSALEELHHRYCYSLYRYCKGKLHSHEDARQIVRDIFISLWENRQNLPVGFPLSLHLYSSVRRAVINRLHEKTQDQEAVDLIEKQIIPGFSLNYLIQARQPVKLKELQNMQQATQLKPAYSYPWLNMENTIGRLKNLKHSVRHLLNFL